MTPRPVRKRPTAGHTPGWYRGWGGKIWWHHVHWKNIGKHRDVSRRFEYSVSRCFETLDDFAIFIFSLQFFEYPSTVKEMKSSQKWGDNLREYSSKSPDFAVSQTANCRSLLVVVHVMKMIWIPLACRGVPKVTLSWQCWCVFPSDPNFWCNSWNYVFSRSSSVWNSFRIKSTNCHLNLLFDDLSAVQRS